MLTSSTFNIPIYDYCMKVVVFDDWNELAAKYPEVGKRTMACTVEHLDAFKVMVCVPPDYVVAVHECEHTKNIIWKHIGYTPQADNDEVDAYLIESIFGKVKKIIDKHLASKC